MRYERPSSITGLTWLLMWVLALLVPDIRSALATDEGIAGAPATEVPPQTPQGTSGTARSREQALYTRSLQLLKRQPRPGAALDRVLQFHEEQDSFPQFLAELVAAQTQPGDTSAAAILGMAESFLGHDQQARQALQQATVLRPNDPVMRWLLGQVCLKQNDADTAVEHLQQALALQPATPDLLPIARELSLALRRAGRAEEISTLWQEIEKQVGPNERVAEQIAGLVHSAGDIPEAIRRFEELSGTHSDPWKATQFGIMAADLKQQAGQSDAALRDFQTLLSTLAPDSPQARRIRERIDAGFRRSGDLPGLVIWLQKRLDENPDDLDSLINLAALLTQTGQPQEAERKLREALTKAPSSVRLLRALIRHLRDQGQQEAAIVIYESMEQQSLLQPDDLDDWAGLCLKLSSVSPEQQRQLATNIWKKQLQGQMDDPVLLRQTALRLRSTAAPDEVIALYDSALRLNPGDVVTREQYGEYLLMLRRTDDALQVWRSIAEGRQQRPDLLRTLGTILHRFGQTREAITTFQQACTLDPDFEELLRLAQLMGDYQEGASRPFSEQSLQLLAQAESLSASEEEAERILQMQARVLQNSGQLSQRIDVLQRELFAPPSDNSAGIEPPTVERWLQLATLCQAAERLADAVQAAEQAVKQAPESVRALRLMSSLYRASGRLADTVRLTQLLLRLDPRSRLVHLQTLAELELELGHLPEAANAAQKLAAMADNSVEVATFSSRLLMQAGQAPEALRILKRTAAASPEDPELCLNYLKALVDARQRESAEEYCWQLLERRLDDDEMFLGVIPVLAELLQQSGRSSELLTRLELLLASEDDSGRLTRCLSAAWMALGDSANARRALEQLQNSTEAQPEDSLRLVELCLAENDVKGAQQVLSRIQPDQLPETLRTQAEELLLQAVASGAQDLSANAISSRWSREELLRRVDQLLADGSTPAALAILQQLSVQDSEEAGQLGRLAIGLWRQSSRQEAVLLFRKLLQTTARPQAGGSDITSQPNAVPGLQNPAPEAIEIHDFHWWEQQFAKSNRILLATDKLSVLELQRCLEQPLPIVMVALLALGEDAAQRGQFDALYDEFQRAAEQSATAAWDLWMLRRLWSSGHGKSWTNMADSLRLSRSGHPDGAAAVLADVVCLFGAVPTDSQNSEATTGPQPASFVAAPLTESEFTVVLESYAAIAEQLSAEDLRRVSQAIVNACLAGPAELQQILTTFTIQLRDSPGKASDGLLALRLAADFARTTNQPQLSLPDVLSALSTDHATPAGSADCPAPWQESRIALVADILDTAATVLTAEAVTETLNWWVRLRAAESNEWRARQAPAQLPMSLLSTSSNRPQPPAAAPGTQFLTSADSQLLQRLATTIRQWNDSPADWSEGWKAGLAGRPSDEKVPAVLAWMVVSDPRMHPETHTEGLDLLTQWIPEDPALLIRQIADHASAGDYGRALERLDQLPDNDPQLFRARELKALQLATLSGSQSRADLAATRLQGLQLSAAEQTEFLRLLRLGGQTELYSNEVQRLFPASSALPPERQMEQLNLLVARGQHQEAVQLADELLRNTVANSGTRFRRTSRITADDVRRRAEEIRRQFGQEPASQQAAPR